MRRGFRRRRTRVTWLPVPGSLWLNANTLTSGEEPRLLAFTDLQAPGSAWTNTRTIEAPLTLDNSTARREAGLTLANVQASSLGEEQEVGYRLRRIVGKLFIVSGVVDGSQTYDPGVIVTAGIMVRRTDPETGISVAPGADIDTTSREQVRDPWVWQRTFLLGNAGIGGTPLINASVDSALTLLAPFNFEVGGTKDGCCMDQKTNRVIGPEERLFFDISWYPANFFAVNQNQSTGNRTLNVWFDYRLLASGVGFRYGNRRNASR